MKFLELTPAQLGCIGTIAIFTGMATWVYGALWCVNWMIAHVRFV